MMEMISIMTVVSAAKEPFVEMELSSIKEEVKYVMMVTKTTKITV